MNVATVSLETASEKTSRGCLLFFVTEDWYFCSHRLPLAQAARADGFDVVVVTRVTAHGEIIRRAGLRVVPIEIVRTGLNPFRELVTLWRLIGIYRRERPDVAHHVALKPVLYGTIAARWSGVRRVVNALAGMGWMVAADSALRRGLKAGVRFAMRRLLRTGTVIVQNPDDSVLLQTIGVPAAGIRLIPGSGVDLGKFAAAPPPAGDFTVVLPARLLWSKGVGEFVAAAGLLRQRGLTARFVLAGQPDQMNPAAVPAKQIEEWVAQGLIEHLGWVADMPALLARCHAVCLPSYYGEGIPKCLIEAAAAGRPIVTTDMPGCREIVHDGDNGILVPPRDAAAVAAAIERLLRDPALCARLGKRGRERAENEFGLDAIVAQTLALYR